MEREEKNRIGYREHYYGSDNDDNRFQCFNCVHGKRIGNNVDTVQCFRWNMVTSEDDVCNAFKFHTYWAFIQTEEDKVRRRKKLICNKRGPLYNDIPYQYSEDKYTQYDTSVPNDTKSPYVSREGCYIATAVYGGYDEPQVLILRKYRDEVLKQTAFGRLFIKIYYAISSSMAQGLKSCTWLNKRIRHMLDDFVERIENKYIGK